MAQTNYIAQEMIATLECAWRDCGNYENLGAMHLGTSGKVAGKAYFICYRHCVPMEDLDVVHDHQLPGDEYYSPF